MARAEARTEAERDAAANRRELIASRIDSLDAAVLKAEAEGRYESAELMRRRIDFLAATAGE